MSEELKKRTKKFALDVIKLCSGLPQTLETRHAIGQVIRSSSSTAANYRSACRAKSKADFISKLGTVEEKADESGFWLEMLRDILQLRTTNDEFRMPVRGAKPELRQSQLDIRTLQELDRLEDEADQLVAITVASKKTARGGND
jgi:four helix bundle protein